MGKKVKEKKPKGTLRCNCGHLAYDIKEMREHYLKHHPNGALAMYDQFGTTGDEFADFAIKEARVIIANKQNIVMQANNKLAEDKLRFDELFSMYSKDASELNKLRNTIAAISSTIKAAVDKVTIVCKNSSDASADSQ